MEYIEKSVALLTDRGFTPEDARHAAKVAFKDAKKAFPKDKVVAEGEDAANDETGKARVLMFLTDSQYADIVAYIVEHKDDFLAASHEGKDKAKNTKTNEPGFGEHRKAIESIIAEPRGLVRLFGRMIASLPEANTDSAIQVAHAITVHQQAPEMDYLTAVDDIRAQDKSRAGAGGIFPAEFTSGLFYRYANINLDNLLANGFDADDLRTFVPLVVESFVQSMPNGKQTASAAHSRPSVVVVEIRERPENLVNAFEKPIQAGQNGFVQEAAKAFDDYANATREAFGETPEFTGHLNVVPGVDLTAFGEKQSLDSLSDALRRAL